MGGRVHRWENVERAKESAYLPFRCREIYRRNRCHSLVHPTSEPTDVMNVPSPEP